MPFAITQNVHVERASDGTVCHLRHLQEPYIFGILSGRVLAEHYVRDVAETYGIPPDSLAGLDRPFRLTNDLTSESTRLRFAAESVLVPGSALAYVQTFRGLPIWEAGVSVTLQAGPARVTSSL